MKGKPLAIDLYCGLGGWTAGLLAEGWDVIGIDVERHVYGDHRYPARLVLQDVRTIHGSQLRDASLIVASSPCQEFSYRAMPWKRAKALGPPLLGMELFAQAERIQREAIAAAGRFIPMVQENVRGAQKYAGRARWHYGSYYLWGDVPALMPITLGRTVMKEGVTHRSNGATNFHGLPDHIKVGDRNTRHLTNQAESDGVKPPGGGADGWFGDNHSPMRQHSSGSFARKAASARIAKIPLPLARHIARTYYPRVTSASAKAEAPE